MTALIPQIIHTLTYVIAIVTLLGGVIAVHEFGHFIFAKWAGIRVDTFSIGFGPKLFARKWGETEYCLSLIPLGGFVKIYGQDPEELEKDENPQPERAFVNKNLRQKLGVLIGGPLFNYILAILIFGLLAVAGVQKLPPIATRVIAESPAYLAGLRSGDYISAVQGTPTKTFEEVAEVVAQNPEKTLTFTVVREGKQQDLPITVQKEHALTPYGEQSVAGVLEGMEPLGRESVLATTLEKHPWGFQSGDRVVQMEGSAIGSWEEMEKVLAKALESGQKTIQFSLQRGSEKIDLQSPDLSKLIRDSKKDVHAFLDLAGIYNPELIILEVMKDSPAEKAGVLAGDLVITANGKRVKSFDHLRGSVQLAGETVAKKNGSNLVDGVYTDSLKLEIERKGERKTLVSAIKSTKGKDPLGETIVTYTIGIQSAGRPLFPSNLILERTLNPFKAIWIGTSETVNHTVMTVVGLKKLAFGEVSAKTVGGPIMIGKLAGDTLASRGWRDFLRVMAIISISLGVFNLIPIPILDGGHIVFAVVESIRGRPLSQQVQQTFLKVGLSLILVLMVFALYNDISRVVPLPF